MLYIYIYIYQLRRRSGEGYLAVPHKTMSLKINQQQKWSETTLAGDGDSIN